MRMRRRAPLQPRDPPVQELGQQPRSPEVASGQGRRDLRRPRGTPDPPTAEDRVSLAHVESLDGETRAPGPRAPGRRASPRKAQPPSAAEAARATGASPPGQRASVKTPRGGRQSGGVVRRKRRSGGPLRDASRSARAEPEERGRALPTGMPTANKAEQKRSRARSGRPKAGPTSGAVSQASAATRLNRQKRTGAVAHLRGQRSGRGPEEPAGSGRQRTANRLREEGDAQDRGERQDSANRVDLTPGRQKEAERREADRLARRGNRAFEEARQEEDPEDETRRAPRGDWLLQRERRGRPPRQERRSRRLPSIRRTWRSASTSAAARTT